jgi:hypothetical protein
MVGKSSKFRCIVRWYNTHVFGFGSNGSLWRRDVYSHGYKYKHRRNTTVRIGDNRRSKTVYQIYFFRCE